MPRSVTCPARGAPANLQEDFQPLRLGVLLPNWTDYFRPEVLRGIAAAQDELREFNVEIILDECRTDVPGEAGERLDALIAKGVRGIALCAINDLSIESKASALVDQGIPIITFNSDLPNSKRVCFVGQNYNKSGRIAAELVSKCIPPQGRVLAMCGNLEFDGHRRRLTGFCERMHEKGFPSDRIEIIETYNDYHVTYRKVTESPVPYPRPCGNLHGKPERGGLHRRRPPSPRQHSLLRLRPRWRVLQWRLL